MILSFVLMYSSLTPKWYLHWSWCIAASSSEQTTDLADVPLLATITHGRLSQRAVQSRPSTI